jgi:hypothetical protein
VAFRSRAGPGGQPVAGRLAVGVHIVWIQKHDGHVTVERDPQAAPEDLAIVGLVLVLVRVGVRVTAVRLDPPGVVGVA